MKNLQTLLIILTAALFFTACEKEEIIEQTERQQIVLLSDYSAGSDVIISIEGTLKSRYPEAEITYLEAAPFNVTEAAYQLQVAAENYPEGSFFMVLVEPGAATNRMVFKTDKNQFFVAPNNSVSTRLFHATTTPNCFQIENPFECEPVNPSDLRFMDVYTCAIIDLLEKRELSDFGSKIVSPETFEVQDARLENGTIYGQLIYTDNFGNCISNIPENLLATFSQGDLLEVSYGERTFFASLGNYYSSVPIAQNVLFCNGLKKLELSVNYGDLSARYNIGAGTSIQIKKKTVTIGFLQYNSHTQEFVEQVKTSISTSGVDAVYTTKNADGDFKHLQQLIAELIDEGVDIIVPFSTPATQAAVLYTPKEIPLVFTVVTDPASAGIFEGSGNITGLSDAPNYKELFTLVKQIVPQLETAGSIYNNTESNSVFAQQKLTQYSSLFQLNYKAEIASSENEIQNAYQNIQNTGAQAILISDDNLMANNCSALVEIAINDSIPVFGTAVTNATNGALASISIDYNELCSSTGDMVISVIRGQNTNDIPVVYFDTKITAINTNTAKQLGITIPETILANANYIFD